MRTFTRGSAKQLLLSLAKLLVLTPVLTFNVPYCGPRCVATASWQTVSWQSNGRILGRTREPQAITDEEAVAIASGNFTGALEEQLLARIAEKRASGMSDDDILREFTNAVQDTVGVEAETEAFWGRWSEEASMYSFVIRLPRQLKKQEVICSVRRSKLWVQIKGDEAPLLVGQFASRVRADELSWLLDDDERLDGPALFVDVVKERESEEPGQPDGGEAILDEPKQSSLNEVFTDLYIGLSSQTEGEAPDPSNRPEFARAP